MRVASVKAHLSNGTPRVHWQPPRGAEEYGRDATNKPSQHHICSATSICKFSTLLAADNVVRIWARLANSLAADVNTRTHVYIASRHGAESFSTINNTGPTTNKRSALNMVLVLVPPNSTQRCDVNANSIKAPRPSLWPRRVSGWTTSRARAGSASGLCSKRSKRVGSASKPRAKCNT